MTLFLALRPFFYNRFSAVLTNDEKTENAFIVVQVTLKLPGEFARSRKRSQHVIAFGLVVDGISQTAASPFVYLLDFTAVGSDYAGILFDYCPLRLILKLRRDDIHGFVLIHAFHLLMVLWRRTYAAQEAR